MQTSDSLIKYVEAFSNLNRYHKAHLGYAPHKAVLLLALLDEVERGNIVDNFVPLTPELITAFRAYWRALVPPETWSERFVTPFRHLTREGFWELLKDGEKLSEKQLGHPTWLNELRGMIDGGRFAPELWQLLQDTKAVAALRSHLLQIYFDTTQEKVQLQLPARPIDYEVDKLISEAQSRFVTSRKEKKQDDGYYVRHVLFPRVIKKIYNNTCAACGLMVSTTKTDSIVDAAHIMPFGIFHNDHPRNGIAFCKNHHWGFDAGWFTISEQYTLLVSSNLQNAEGYIMAGATLRLPANTEHIPEPRALAWHRDNTFLG